MKAEIISIGTELLLGEITNTNATFLASQLPSLGIDLHHISTVGDNQQRLVSTLEQAWQRSDLIITTGGLGPTQDDITREAIAELLHEEITIDSALVKNLQELFCFRRLEMPPSNIKQASIIPSVQIIPNPRGTAPGWQIERDGRLIVAMPGPPREMQFMWSNEIVPKLKQKVRSSVIVSKTLKIFGVGEAKVDELVSPFLSTSNPTLATYAKSDGIHLRITAKARHRGETEALIAQREAEIRTVLNGYIWGTDSETLESAVGELLAARGLSLAVMESDTGGLLTNIITNIPESLIYFKGGLIAYSNEAKIAFGINGEIISRYGAISVEMAEAMASIARKKLGADIGIGIAGVMGTTKVQDKPIGSVFIGIDDRETIYRFVQNFPGQHIQIKQRAITSALFELRKILIYGGTHAPHN